MTAWDSLLDVLILLLAAFVLGAICERLRQSAILGYLLAGTLLGPNALQWIDSTKDVTMLAELGVAVLLFTIGLEFSFRRLMRLGPGALPAGGLQVGVTMLIAAVIAVVIGQPIAAAVAIGAMIALSSTATVLRLLMGRAEIDTLHGRSALGILLMQDVAVVPLVLLVSMMGVEGTAIDIAWGVGRALLLAAALVVAFLIVFNSIVPLVLGALTARRNRELPVLLAIIVGLGSTWLAHEAGLSPALGAFVAGVLLAETPYATQIRADVASLRTLLMTLFFSSVGMLGDPQWIAANWALVIAVVVAIVFGKAMITWGLLSFFKQSHRSGLAAGICLAQVGEFSFVLATVARGKVVSENVFMLMVSATIGTLFLTPYLVAGAPAAAERIVLWLRRRRLIRRPPMELPEPIGGDGGHVVIVGFGPAGVAVGESLYGKNRHVIVLDLNPRAVAAAKRLDFDVHLGDATHPDVLEHAAIAKAAALVVTIPQPEDARRVIQLTRTMAPDTPVFARARYHVYRWELEFAGAQVVIDEEQHVGERLARELRRELRREKASGSSE